MNTCEILQCTGGSLVLPPRLFPPAEYYAVAAAHGPLAAVARTMRFNKRDKSVHRYTIADTRGRLDLTVPVAHPAGSASAAGVPWSEVAVSAHGQWWETHRTALESAYGRTPFFEFYIGRFEGFLAPVEAPLTVGSLCARADAIVASILGLQPLAPADTATPDQASTPCCALPYWQVRASSLGFIAGLSILDLIFNLGPEAPMHLLRMQRAMGLRH